MLKNGLYIFHRDLRLRDNIGLINASKQCENLFTCFIFNPTQVNTSNIYRSEHSIQFMIESLKDLSNDIASKNGELLTYYGAETQVISSLIGKLAIDGIFFNKDYSPFAIEREKKARDICNKGNIVCETYHDYCLLEPGSIHTGSTSVPSNRKRKILDDEDIHTNQVCKPYRKFTPFYNAIMNTHYRAISPPNDEVVENLTKPANDISDLHISLDTAMEKFTAFNPKILVSGGRINGLSQLDHACKEQKKYAFTRDQFKNKTTLLSSYIKFGCISFREVYTQLKQAFGMNSELVRQLIWREFYTHVLYNFPDVLGQSYYQKYRNIEWEGTEHQLQLWKEGKTGFPIVDASMRELNTTGYMHNRGRMTAATFLVKTLLIDWQEGEKYYSQKLTDADIAVNNASWQGISGTGVDMKPYFRDMNPWLQSAKFDKECDYIKKWIPELKTVMNKDIHHWYEVCHEKRFQHIKYPKPIVNYKEQKQKMIAMYKNV